MNQTPTTSGAPQPAPQVPPAQPPTQSGIAATAIAPATTTTTTVPSSIVGPAPFHPYRAPIAITSFAKNDKLSADADNWLAWRTRITSILKHKKTYGIATGTITKPPGPDTDPAVAEWIDLDLAATKQILVGLSNNEVNHVVNCHTAAETWSTLRTIHEPTHIQLGQFSISMLWQKRAAEDTDITDHLNELTHTRNLLTSQGKRVSDADFKDVMIETLPRSWNPFVSSLLAQATTKSMTVTQLKLTLSEEHQHLKRQNQSDATAYAASSPRTKKGKQVCSICERRNHVTKDCRWFGKNAPKCDICGKIGNEMEKCWRNPTNKGKGHTNKERDEKGKKNPASSSSKGKGKARANVAEQESSSDGELEKSFTAFVNISDEGEMSKASQADLSAYSWIIDSGATTLRHSRHISPHIVKS